MSIIKQILLKDEELRLFVEELFNEYESRKSAALAISWAFKKVRPKDDLIQYDFPEVILIGEQILSDNQKFICERFLGRFIQIQPEIIIFFPGDDLSLDSSQRFNFCGLAFLGKECNGADQITIRCKQSDATCYTSSFDPNNIKLFYQFGPAYNCTGGNYSITPEVMAKIKKLFDQPKQEE